MNDWLCLSYHHFRSRKSAIDVENIPADVKGHRAKATTFCVDIFKYVFELRKIVHAVDLMTKGMPWRFECTCVQQLLLTVVVELVSIPKILTNYCVLKLINVGCIYKTICFQ